MLKFFRLPWAVSGDKTTIPDPAQGSGAVSYAEGFGPDYELNQSDPDSKDIPREQYNAALYDVTNAIRELQIQGVPDFITSALNDGVAFSYAANALVRYSDGVVYQSLVGSNTALPTDATKWAPLGPVVTATNDSTRADDSERPASTGWLKGGFAVSLGVPGYIKLPKFLGGVVIQWGQTITSASAGVAVTFPTAFPPALLAVTMAPLQSSAVFATYSDQSAAGMTIHGWDYSGARVSFNAVSWVAVGK